MSVSIPTDWEKVTPRWMTKALRQHHPDAVVGDVKIITRDDGTNRRARFELSYEKGEGPKRLFLKAHSAKHRWVHLRNGNLWIEPSLFKSGAELPVDHPHVYLSVIDTPKLDFLLVMEDLAERGADMRDSTRPLSVDQVANALRGFARLHSLYWGFSRWTHPHMGWVRTWAPAQGWQIGLRRCVPKGLARGGERIAAEVHHYSGDDIVGFWARYVSTLRKLPMTLTHGDAHIGNAYVLPTGDVGLLDWLTRRGEWSQDVGYFLTGALTVADRRAHARDLIEDYRQALDVPQGERPSAEAAWDRYRASQAYGLAIWLSTLGADGYQSQEISTALAERYAAAFVELDTLGALDRA